MAIMQTWMIPGGTSGAKVAMGVGSLCRCCMAMATGLSPSKGTRPVSISYSTTPTLYISLVTSAVWPLACSGLK